MTLTSEQIEAERAREKRAFERWYGMTDFPVWTEFRDGAEMAWLARAECSTGPAGEASESSDLLLRLAVAMTAACNCEIKSPSIEFHRGDCRYRVLQEAHDEIVRLNGVYLSAVKGRQDFRNALREVRKGPTEAEIEAAAKRIWDCERGSEPEWDRLSEHYKSTARHMARAALGVEE